MERIPQGEAHSFKTPSKKINNGDDLAYFQASTAYRDIMIWILQLNRSMFPIKTADGKIEQSLLTSKRECSATVQGLANLITDLHDLVEKAPPDTGPRRFGNVAFKIWFKLVKDDLDRLLDVHLKHVYREFDKPALINELRVYLLGSFGSEQRLDYGTGHELSFLAFLACLWKLGAFEEGKESVIVMDVVQPYLVLIRHLVLTYTLEPAGSHGVWGLDDHSFVPYMFGSAQLGPAIDPAVSSHSAPVEGSVRSAPSPSKVADKGTVSDYKDTNMYFSAIQFIYDVKRGPFWEHSPILYDISGIKYGWAKINKGMLKMYAAEVLGKFPVVQHFPFGSLLRWEADPLATERYASVHAQHQPVSTTAPETTTPTAAAPSGVGTKAPWAMPGNLRMGVPQLQASTGVPSRRAP